MSDETPEPRRRLDLNWVQVVAGALAAVSSAVLLSTLGAAGTLIGAALGSVIVSITSNLYTQGLARGTEKVAVAQTVALRKVSTATEQIATVRRSADAPPTTGAHADGIDEPADPSDPSDPTVRADVADDAPPEEVLRDAEEQLTEAVDDLERASDPEAVAADDTPARSRWASLPWKRIGILTAVLFVVAMVLVTAFEVIGGRTVSSYTDPGDRDARGGTSVTGFFGGGSDADEQEDPSDPVTQNPSPGGPASDEPTDDATGDPTDGATDDPTTDPSGTPTDDPTEDDEDEDLTPTPSPTRGSTTPTTPTPSAPSPTR